jgi:membrane protein DedA with SNARE-associated domain
MKSALRAALLLILLMAIPIVPFLWLGEPFEKSVMKALHQPSPAVVVCWVAGLLTADIFLPIPSSAVITYAGGMLGIWLAALVSWFGLSLGSIAGFAVARRFGHAVVARFSEPADIARLNEFTQRHGSTALILTRALPILAEACVLLLGAGRQSWRRFLPPLLVSNALLALSYAACGQHFREGSAFPVAIVVSGALPLVAALLIRSWAAKTRSGEGDER